MSIFYQVESTTGSYYICGMVQQLTLSHRVTNWQCVTSDDVELRVCSTHVEVHLTQYFTVLVIITEYLVGLPVYLTIRLG